MTLWKPFVFTLSLVITPTLRAGTLEWSAAVDRSAPRNLSGSTLGGNAYISYTSSPAATSVTFTLNGSSTTDNSPPFDLKGNTPNGAPLPLDTFTLKTGTYTLTAVATGTSGTTTTTATFTVDNRHPGPGGQGWAYANSSWPSLHRDSRNADASVLVGPRSVKPTWSALTGDAVITAVTLGPEGHLYATTGREVGKSNLHVFDRDGHELWSSPPVVTPSDLDAEAVGSSVIIDREGIAYLSDDDQLWAYYPDGRLKWVVPIIDSFVTPLFTRDGHIGGITASGDIHLIHREDGSLVAPVMILPGGNGSAAPAVPDGLWEGMMDPAVIEQTWAGLLGTTYKVVNTPCLDPESNRLFIVAAAEEEGEGIFYGVDMDESGPSIAFATPIGPFSATSPALSPRGDQVYATDGYGVLYAVDTETGDIMWSMQAGDSAGSPSIGADGTVFTLTGEEIAAVSPSGNRLWTGNYDTIAARILPTLPSEGGTIPPEAKVDTVVSLTANDLWIGVMFGYKLTLPDVGNRFFLVQKKGILRVDPLNGQVLSGPFPMLDTPENVITPAPDGHLYIGYAAMFSSVIYNSINEELPPFLQIGPPVGGISAFEPRSYRDLLSDGIAWSSTQVMYSINSLELGVDHDVTPMVGIALEQVRASLLTVDDTYNHHEISRTKLNQIKPQLQAAQVSLADAYNRLYQIAVSGDIRWQDGAFTSLEAAQLSLASAASQL